MRGAATFAEGMRAEGIEIVRAAAVREDASEKHAVTPGPLKPAREILGDLLMQAGKPADALREYEAVIAKEPNRLGPTAGAAQAAEKAGDATKAAYYRQARGRADRDRRQPRGPRSRRRSASWASE